MLQIVHKVLKPEYRYRPALLWQRQHRLDPTQKHEVNLPWGHRIAVQPNDDVGRTLLRLGVFELPVVEAIFRLVHPGDRCLDIGANLGVMTLAMASRVGEAGTVVAYEPHPEIRKDLNMTLLRNELDYVQLRAEACSDQPGTASLNLPAEFSQNRGVGSLQNPTKSASKIPIETVRLDEEFPEGVLHLVKLDVEGHEDAVLAGAERLLAEGRLRHLLFEEHAPANSAVIARLRRAGYELFRLERGFWGPALLEDLQAGWTSWEPPNFIATIDPESLRRAYRSRGWLALS